MPEASHHQQNYYLLLLFINRYTLRFDLIVLFLGKILNDISSVSCFSFLTCSVLLLHDSFLIASSKGYLCLAVFGIFKFYGILWWYGIVHFYKVNEGKMNLIYRCKQIINARVPRNKSILVSSSDMCPYF